MGNSHSLFKKSRRPRAKIDKHTYGFGERVATAIHSLDSALRYPVDTCLLTVIHLGTCEISGQVICTALVTADIEMESLMLEARGFKWMGDLNEKDKYGRHTRPTVGLKGSGAAIARQLIRDWGIYNCVAFKEVVVLVCGLEVRSFLKIVQVERGLYDIKEEKAWKN